MGLWMFLGTLAELIGFFSTRLLITTIAVTSLKITVVTGGVVLGVFAIKEFSKNHYLTKDGVLMDKENSIIGKVKRFSLCKDGIELRMH
jgi:hypothetical protein